MSRDLDGLIAELEGAKEGSGSLDWRIRTEALGDWPSPHGDDPDDAPTKPYTTSLDAAMSLVPQGWDVSFFKYRWEYTKCELQRAADIPPYKWLFVSGHKSYPTAPLAVVIAALRALQSPVEPG